MVTFLFMAITLVIFSSFRLEYNHKREMLHNRTKDNNVSEILVDTNREYIKMLEKSEVFLFHSPNQNQEIVNTILRQGLDSRVAAHGLIGSGIYFAENASKSDEICKDVNKGTFYMLICRVKTTTSIFPTYSTFR